MENRLFAYAKTKTQINFAVTVKLISAFVFATWIVQSLCFLNPKFVAFSHLLWLYSPVCVGPVRPFSHNKAHMHSTNMSNNMQIRLCSCTVYKIGCLCLLLLRPLFYKLSLVMRKLDFCICENKEADQLCGSREADQRLCFRYMDSTIPLLSKFKIARLKPSSMAVQPGFLSDLVGYPEDWFSHNEAQFQPTPIL